MSRAVPRRTARLIGYSVSGRAGSTRPRSELQFRRAGISPTVPIKIYFRKEDAKMDSQGLFVQVKVPPHVIIYVIVLILVLTGVAM